MEWAASSSCDDVFVLSIHLGGWSAFVECDHGFAVLPHPLSRVADPIVPEPVQEPDGLDIAVVFRWMVVAEVVGGGERA
jgi:hypothetical protein